MNHLPRLSGASALLFTGTVALFLGGCVAAPPESGEGPEPVARSGEAQTSPSVDHVYATSCSTGGVSGLDKQIIAEGNCISPGAFDDVPSRNNLSVGGTVHRRMETKAKQHLLDALDASPHTQMTVASMLRTIAQQYLLYRWYENGRCGIQLAAHPGESNHETGLAIDVDQYTTWRSHLQAHSFQWLGSQDVVHFDYDGSGAVDHRGLDVKAFQKLWNENHPNDTIAVDGDWGPETEARMKKAPAKGFAKGASCQAHNARPEGAFDAEADDASDVEAELADPTRAIEAPFAD